MITAELYDNALRGVKGAREILEKKYPRTFQALLEEEARREELKRKEQEEKERQEEEKRRQEEEKRRIRDKKAEKVKEILLSEDPEYNKIFKVGKRQLELELRETSYYKNDRGHEHIWHERIVERRMTKREKEIRTMLGEPILDCEEEENELFRAQINDILESDEEKLDRQVIFVYEIDGEKYDVVCSRRIFETFRFDTFGKAKVYYLEQLFKGNSELKEQFLAGKISFSQAHKIILDAKKEEERIKKEEERIKREEEKIKMEEEAKQKKYDDSRIFSLTNIKRVIGNILGNGGR